MGNPYLRVAIDNARSQQSELSAQKDAIGNKIADVILLKRFFATWDEKSYSDALETLPVDNLETPNTDEGVSEEEFQEKASEIIGKSWDELNSDEETATSVAFLVGKVREYIGQQAAIQNRVDNVDSDIANLTALQEAEANDPSSSSGDIPSGPS
jgi:hypothetical protein